MLLAAGSVSAAQGEVRGRVTGEHVVPAIVYAADLPDETASPQARATLQQLHLSFSPAVLPVLQGTIVDFINLDATAHNVFSPSPPAFDLGTFGEGARSFLFRSPGAHVILCNVHLEMVAWIVVLRNPVFSSVDEDGHFALKLPAGHHRLVLWRPREPEQTLDVDAPMEEGTTIEWVLSQRRP